MVSNTLRIDVDELFGVLKRLHQECSSDPDYLEWRRQLPPDWPL